MNPGLMIVLVVLIAVIGRVLTARYKAMDHARDQHGPAVDHARADQELRQLKERVAVLERVITDNHGSLDLDREIERLRDR